VRDSALEGLEPGEAVSAIDGAAPGDFVGERMKYIGASDDRSPGESVPLRLPLAAIVHSHA
jgi:hypothetical protein